MNRRWTQVLGLIIGAVCLAVFLVFFFDWETTRRSLASAVGHRVALAVAAFVATVSLRAVRWTYVVRCLEPIRWSQGYYAFMATTLVNFLLPIRFGEVLRLGVAKKAANVSYASSTAASLVDRLAFLLLVVVCLCFTPLAGFRFAGWSARFIPVLVSIVLACVLFLLLGEHLPRLLRGSGHWLLLRLRLPTERAEHVLDGRICRFIYNALAQAHISSFRRRELAVILAMGLATLGLDGLCQHELMNAFGVPVTPAQALLGGCLMNILFFVPCPPAQVGTAEMYPVLIYSVGLQRAAERVATPAIFWHLATLAVIVALGLHAAAALGLSTRALWRTK